MRKIAEFLIGLLATGTIAGAVGAQTAQLAMLDRLERGGWELTDREDAGSGKSKICLTSGRELIQLRHAGLRCRSTVVDDTPHEVTVQYSCPGNGYGRTHIRRETDELVQIDTQGIERGLPFASAFEARWVGSCQR